jgi:CheY-like chemotaxis protein
VTDTGQGVPREIRRKIFDPFFTTKGPKSSGLGLSVSYSIIERHGGEITVSSQKGKGTTFSVKLPTAEKPMNELVREEAYEDGRKASILVIDDEPEIRNSLSELLSLEGHEVTVAQDGEEGLSTFQTKEFDMVLTDLGMPGMSGWQLAEKIKKLSPETPVAIITGWGLQPDRERMKRSGVDLFISKPFRLNDIRKLVTQGMEYHSGPLARELSPGVYGP